MKEKSKSQNKFHVIIREARATDAAGIARVTVDTWRTTYTGMVNQEFLDSLSYEKSTDGWQKALSDTTSPRFLYVAEDGNSKIVGFAGGGPEATGNKTFTGELGVIYILKSHQRRGIGRQMAVKVALSLQQRGHNSMIVWVIAANPNRAFYEALGGQTTGKREKAIGGKSIPEIANGWHDLSAFGKMLKGIFR
jgi:L-amino acid N-acyltransferase YncA